MELIGTKEAGMILGCTSSNMRHLCADEEKRKKLKANKYTRDWLFEKSAVEKYAEKKEAKK